MSEQKKLAVYNTLSRKKEAFEPLNPPFVGMYVCGPTVYGDAHLGHAKSYVSFDVIYRYLKYLGFKVRYVQNITDVGHLTDDADEGEDKILKQSRLEKTEPMEIVEHYMAAYYRDMDALNVARPSIAPRPSAHIPEQIEAIKHLIKKGFAYEVNGSVYFDVSSYQKGYNYGMLSGRKVEELLEGSASRALDKQSEKKSPLDFALWKSAGSGHLMQWDSPWGKGYPGWHIECTVMSQKYLGETFDIHGGGMENMFPHHECEIAQAQAHSGKDFAKYWIHNNMVTLNGQKMGKSLGNSISCRQLFEGKHELLNDAYSPMTVRFFILQSHYRSTLDFSNEALKAAGKGFNRLIALTEQIAKLKANSDKNEFNFSDWLENCEQAMNDDFNTPILIANLFDSGKIIRKIEKGELKINEDTLLKFKTAFESFVKDILGLIPESDQSSSGNDEVVSELVKLIIDLRKSARENKDFATSDKIRDALTKAGIKLKDTREGTDWSLD